MASRGSDLNNAEVIERLDRIMAELLELRGEFVGRMPSTMGNGIDADDQADVLIDTTSAAARWGLARDTVAKICREVEGIGVWKGERWQVRVGALRRHLERKNNQ